MGLASESTRLLHGVIPSDGNPDSEYKLDSKKYHQTRKGTIIPRLDPAGFGRNLAGFDPMNGLKDFDIFDDDANGSTSISSKAGSHDGCGKQLEGEAGCP
jgi:hypothetical protein